MSGTVLAHGINHDHTMAHYLIELKSITDSRAAFLEFRGSTHRTCCGITLIVVCPST